VAGCLFPARGIGSSGPLRAQRAVRLRAVNDPDHIDVELDLRCIECGALSSGAARAWRAYRSDLEEGDEQAVAFYCPACAERVGEGREEPGAEV
jgi:hypothetical protein